LTKRDYYEVLGVSRTATSEEIKKTYRKVALQCHPDKNPGDKAAEDRFKEATEAYSCLSDQASRAKYDQFGHAAFSQGGGGFQGDFGGFEDVFSDIFGAFFGGAAGGAGGTRSRGRPGRDLKCDLEITFEEAAFGAEREISIQRRVACETCEGTGSAEGTRKACAQCGGAGQIRVQQGFFAISRTCHVCGGAGEVVSNPCKACAGGGLKPVQSKISVRVPAGIDHGQRLKLRGEGEAGVMGGPNGDLYVQIAVQKHPIFEREESDIICEVPVSYATAVLGAEIEVPTLSGVEKVKIPAGTQSGKIFRLKGKGVQVLGANRRGDQHVHVVIEIPKKVSPEHKELLEKLREIEKRDANSESRRFFDKVRELF
jgi:molecular chaperone DnaJ